MFGNDAKVLLILLADGRTNRSVFQRIYKMNYAGAIDSLRMFKDLGIVDSEELGDWRDTQVWFLTDKGKIVAQKLADLIAIIEKEEN